MLNATIIGQYFLSKNPNLTDIQIQKLVYYAYSWYMVKNNGKKLFDEKPQAWVHGPVFRSLFDSMKNYKKFSSISELDIDEEVEEFLDIIYNVYGKYSGNELEKMTHNELPWMRARAGLQSHEFSQRLIEDEDIIKCYGN
jgi:uncharacterized phage-associated protein